ncbi:EcsC family protein [Hymenobacter sp. 15J16-1T3B]|uniref:EcsC family protein n=1 Tax=Hymenobacter sp. 15J16-1T3B TaxID=2886941 RepID=UPI001D115359|nr:EcsC family protein [Hymenobacter sp. 15J16-1T3B]MCC3159390.1 EcsC family protein [Hymenobacter sp. 15J16-1T3B]
MYLTDSQAHQELLAWQQKMQAAPGPLDRLTRTVQTRLNALLPEKLHQAITATIKQMVRGVLFGSTHLTRRPLLTGTLAEREGVVRQRIRRYRHVAVVEGAATGAAGFFVGLTDFPLLLGIKLKLLFDVAALYGYDVRDYTERLYLLHVFQLAFSSQHTRNATYQRLVHWNDYRQGLPPDAADFDWRTFQQEYRDYIDLAKLAQLVPFIGAAVGAVANYRLLEQLGETAMNCYRMRYFDAEAGAQLGG